MFLPSPHTGAKPKHVVVLKTDVKNSQQNKNIFKSEGTSTSGSTSGQYGRVIAPAVLFNASSSNSCGIRDPSLFKMEATSSLSKHSATTSGAYKIRKRPRKKKKPTDPLEEDARLRLSIYETIDKIQNEMDRRKNAMVLFYKVVKKYQLYFLKRGMRKWKRYTAMISVSISIVEKAVQHLNQHWETQNMIFAFKVFKIHLREGRRLMTLRRNEAACIIQNLFRRQQARKKFIQHQIIHLSTRTYLSRLGYFEYIYRKGFQKTFQLKLTRAKIIQKTYRRYKIVCFIRAQRQKEYEELRKMITEENNQRLIHNSAVLIQKKFREMCHREKIKIEQNKSAKVIQHNYRQIMERRERLRINAKRVAAMKALEAHRKRYSREGYGAALIQKRFRDYRAAVQELTVKKGAAVLIQKKIRVYLRLKRIAEMQRKQAARRIQLGYKEHQRRLEEDKRRMETERVSAIILQTVFRFHRTRIIGAMIVQRRFREFLRRKQAAKRVQKACKRYLRRKYASKTIRDFARKYLRRKRGAITIQQMYYRYAKRTRAADRIQKFCRRYLTRKQAVTKIQRVYRQYMIRIISARRIFRFWKWYLRRKVAAYRIQRAFRRHSELCVKKARSARIIQSAYRRYKARHRYAEEIQRVFRGFRCREWYTSTIKKIVVIESFARMSIVKIWQRKANDAALAIQRCYWRAKDRYMLFVRFARRRAEMERVATIKVQRVFRGKKARERLRAAAKHKLDTKVKAEYVEEQNAKNLQLEWSLYVAREKRKKTTLDNEKRKIREELQAVKKKEIERVESELNSWVKFLASDPNGYNDEYYYHNTATQVNTWERPRAFFDKVRRELEQKNPPNPDQLRLIWSGWSRVLSKDAKSFYFFNNLTGETSLSRPVGFSEKPEDFKPNPLICEICKVEEASRQCLECSKTSYCVSCFVKSHRAAALRRHKITPVVHPYNEDEINEDYDDVSGDCYINESDLEDFTCTECMRFEATKICNQCGDSFCDSCYESVHGKGDKRSHSWVPWHPSVWEELYDDVEKRTFYFNTETKETTNEKPTDLMFGQEKQRFLERERAEKAELDRIMELKNLEDEVKELEAKREKIIRETHAEMEAEEAYLKATSTTRKFAKFIAPSLVHDDDDEIDKLKGNAEMSEEEKRESVSLDKLNRKKRKRKKKNKTTLSIEEEAAYLQRILLGKSK